MKNCFIYQLDRENRFKVGIADLTNMGEMVPGTMTLTRINIPPAYRGQGHGSRFLKHICREADRHGVAISLEIMPSGPLDYYALAEWYERHDFEDANLGGIYIRQPSGVGNPVCKPSKYAVVAANRIDISYGFRCAKHGIATKRYSTRELRDQRLKEHKKRAKKN